MTKKRNQNPFWTLKPSTYNVYVYIYKRSENPDRTLKPYCILTYKNVVRTQIGHKSRLRVQ